MMTNTKPQRVEESTPLAEEKPLVTSGIRRALRALYVKADQHATGLVEAALRRAGYEAVVVPVQTVTGLRRELALGRWEVVFCNCSASGFDCASAIAVVRESGQDLPFLAISGSIGEDRAAAIMKSGAHDFIRDDQLGRLPGAVAREINDARLRRAHRKVLAELSETTTRLTTLVESAPLAVIEFDQSGRVLRWNPAAKLVFGWSGNEVVGGLLPMVPTSRRTDFNAMCCEAQRGKSFTGVEERWLRKDGTAVELTLSLAPTPSGLLLLASKNGDMARLQRQLDRAQHREAIGQLTSGLAQEISAPLAVVEHELDFLVQALEELVVALSAHRELATAGEDKRSVQSAAKRMASLCKSIDMDFLLLEIPRALDKAKDGACRVSRIVHAMRETGPPTANGKGLLDLNRALECTCTIARSEFRHVADLVLDLQPDLPVIECDPAEINCILLNLLVNAAHAVAESVASKGRGVITVSTREEGGMVEVLVHDTGAGIPETVRKRIFEPFFTTKPVGKGTGQGLATAHGIAKRHHGDLSFESQVGSGSTFALRLPKTQLPSSG